MTIRRVILRHGHGAIPIRRVAFDCRYLSPPVTCQAMDQNKPPPLEFELLSALAARLCNPDAPEQAATEIEEAITKLKRFAVLLDNIRWLVLLFGLLIGAVGIKSLFADTKTSGLWSMFAFGFLVIGMALFLFAISVPRLVQTRKRFFVANRYDIAIPVAAQNLLTDLAEGRRKAVLLIDYGVAGPEAVRTEDGKLVDAQIASGLFANRFAPLLLSANKGASPLVSIQLRHTITRPIYIMHEVTPAPDITAAKKDNAQGDPIPHGQKWRSYFLWNLTRAEFKKLIKDVGFYPDNEIKQLKVEIVLQAIFDGIHDPKPRKEIKPGNLFQHAAAKLKSEAASRLVAGAISEHESRRLARTGLEGDSETSDWIDSVLRGNYSTICNKLETKAALRTANFQRFVSIRRK